MIFVWRYMLVGLLALIGGIITIYYGVPIASFLFGWIFGVSLSAAGFHLNRSLAEENKLAYDEFVENLGKGK